ncbi:hypothetical protein BST67_25990 [Bradyrhizobium canariense]|nr:hypothetical protein BST67_25990 [Bradyrhizobium canariense]OSI55491.1 hypothetical protein BSZ15_19820 [Bradyrhizobium canariense]
MAALRPIIAGRESRRGRPASSSHGRIEAGAKVAQHVNTYCTEKIILANLTEADDLVPGRGPPNTKEPT